MATPNSYQELKDNAYDAFIMKFNNDSALLSGDTALCEGTITTYYAAWVPGAESYTWTLPNGWIGTSNTDTIVVTAGTNSGVISVVANKSCSVEPGQQLQITVYPSPTPAVTQLGNVLSVPNGYIAYQWYDANGVIIGATSNTITLASQGTYYVIVTDSNGCTGQSLAFTVSVATALADVSFSLYPNPNHGNFQIRGEGFSGCNNVEIEIFNIVGQNIYSGSALVANGKITEMIDLADLVAPGVYQLRLSSDKYYIVETFSLCR